MPKKWTHILQHAQKRTIANATYYECIEPRGGWQRYCIRMIYIAWIKNINHCNSNHHPIESKMPTCHIILDTPNHLTLFQFKCKHWTSVLCAQLCNAFVRYNDTEKEATYRRCVWCQNSAGYKHLLFETPSPGPRQKLLPNWLKGRKGGKLLTIYTNMQLAITKQRGCRHSQKEWASKTEPHKGPVLQLATWRLSARRSTNWIPIKWAVNEMRDAKLSAALSLLPKNPWSIKLR